MKILKSILFIFFVSIAIQSPQAAEIYRATDEEVIDFLEKGLEDNWFGSYYGDGESNNHKNGYMSEEFKFILKKIGNKMFYDNKLYLSLYLTWKNLPDANLENGGKHGGC